MKKPDWLLWGLFLMTYILLLIFVFDGIDHPERHKIERSIPSWRNPNNFNYE